MEVYVVIDIGCMECGVESLPVGIYRTEEEAERVADNINEKSNCWRDGGQAACEVFKMEVPDAKV